ncbi:MAG: phosphatidylglycerophosphatase A [Betaproteobacteria bacterium]|nr:MAG: phosphatidylglycerophosphatase A [Betaproteobacteria bacterium]
MRFVLANPAHFIAFGFGVGLFPLGPGTLGTVLAFPIYYGLAGILSSQALLVFIAAAMLIGVWVCHVTGRNLGVHDHGGMVWDEIAAFMLVLYFIPPQPMWQALAFLLFRVFDILKPPPIRRLDQKIRNGFGVMLDDLVAAFYALLCLAAAQRVYTWSAI